MITHKDFTFLHYNEEKEGSITKRYTYFIFKHEKFCHLYKATPNSGLGYIYACDNNWGFTELIYTPYKQQPQHNNKQGKEIELAFMKVPLSIKTNIRKTLKPLN